MNQIPFVLLGLGPVSKTLIMQLLQMHASIMQRTGVQFVPVGIVDSSGLMMDRNGIEESMLRKILRDTDGVRKLASVADLLPHERLVDIVRPGTIIVDGAHSLKTVPVVKAALNVGAGVVMANKIPLSIEWSKAQIFFEHPLIRYDATVGAGLPIISTLRYLQDTGDEITRIEASVSGTLGFICTALELGIPYSVAVQNAKNLGYTEPDPRDDLSGFDILRKAVILARTAGWPLEIHQLISEAMYPPSLTTGSIEEFMTALPSLDELYAAQVRLAQSEGKSMRYIAYITPKGGRVGLMSVEREGYSAAKSGPANSVAIYSHRYAEMPLVISGPGAGPEVKVGGVIEDMLQIAAVMQSKEAMVSR